MAGGGDVGGKGRGKGKPPPTGPLVAISVMYVSNALAETVLLPFAPLMVKSFNVTQDETKLGYYAGLLASSFYFGMLLSSSAWGSVSDYIGRKPVLLIGMINNTVCSLVFGFSTSLPMAMIARFVNGLLTGIYPVGRTTMSELCTASNQAAGFSLLSLNWGVGLLLGPAIGGILAQPTIKYPSFFPPGGLFDRFAFSLPCLVLSFFSFVSIIFILFMLPETLGRAKAPGQKKTDESTLTEPLLSSGNDGPSGAAASAASSSGSAEGSSSLAVPPRPSGAAAAAARGAEALPGSFGAAQVGSYGGSVGGHSLSSPSTWLLASEGDQRLVRKASGAQLITAGVTALSAAAAATAAAETARGEAEGEAGLERRASKRRMWQQQDKQQQQTLPQHNGLASGGATGEDAVAEENVTVWVALRERDTIFAALIFATLGFTITAQNEVFPLWGLTPWRYGGLAFESSEVGLCQAAGGLSMIPFQLFIYHRIVERYGPLNTLRIGLVSMMPLLFFPAVRLVRDPYWRIFAAMFFMIWRSASVTIVFTTCVVLVINSVRHPRYLGTVNGVSQSLMMTFEAVAPAAGGSIYAWSVSPGRRYPFNFHFFWILWFALCCIMFGLSLLLTKHINYRKFETTTDEDELDEAEAEAEAAIGLQ